MDDNVIKHHGIPGQKWGVRKQKSNNISENINKIFSKIKDIKQKIHIPKKTNKQNTIDKMNKVEKIRKNKINVYDATELSTSNLTKINARLRNELEYKRLIMQTKQINKEISDQKRSKLNKMLGSVISNVVVPAAYNAGRDILTSKIKKALSKRLGA